MSDSESIAAKSIVITSGPGRSKSGRRQNLRIPYIEARRNHRFGRPPSPNPDDLLSHVRPDASLPDDPSARFEEDAEEFRSD